MKPWYKSVSLWVAIATALLAAVDSLVGSGILNSDSTLVVVAMALGTILKRGMVESTVVKADALKAGVKDPS